MADLLIALIILAAGAGVGPEASLMGAVIAYSVWQCDKLRYLHTHADSVRATPIPTRLRMLYHPTRWIEPATRPQLPLSLQATRPAPPIPHPAMQPPLPPQPPSPPQPPKPHHPRAVGAHQGADDRASASRRRVRRARRHPARLGRYAGDCRGVGRGETPDAGKDTGTLLTGHARVPTRG